MTRFGLLPAVQIPGSTITIWIGNGENGQKATFPDNSSTAGVPQLRTFSANKSGDAKATANYF